MSLLDRFVSDDDGVGSAGIPALFAALASSPHNAPLATLPQTLQAYARAGRNGQSRAAIEAALKLYGFDEATARELSTDAGAAQLAISQKQQASQAATTERLIGGAPSLGGLFGGAPSMTPPAPGGPAAGASLNGTAGSFVDTLVGKESGGNPTARNPNSSATGLTQFTDGTWDEMRRLHPELGLTADGRTNADQSRRAALAYAQDNGKALTEAGHEATPGNLYLGHFLGGGGAVRFLSGLKSDPNAPAAAYADPGAVSANRSVFFNGDGSPKSAQAFYAERTSRFGQGAPQQVASAAGSPGAPPDVLSSFVSTGSPYSGAPTPRGVNPARDEYEDQRLRIAGRDSPLSAEGVAEVRQGAASRPVPAFGSGAPTPPPPSPRPALGVRRPNVDVAETEQDAQRLEGRMGMYPSDVYGVARSSPADRTAPTQTAQADMPAEGTSPAEYRIPEGRPGAGRVFTGRTAEYYRDREQAGSVPNLGAEPKSPEDVRGETTKRAYAARHYDYWSRALAVGSGNGNKALAEYAKSQLEISGAYLKPDAIESKLDAAGITGPERRAIIRNSIGDSRPADQQNYEYGQRNPDFEDYQDRRRDRSGDKIAGDIEARRAAAAEQGLKPGSPQYQSYVLTGKMPREDQQPLSASDKKAILEADEAVMSAQTAIDNLNAAKGLSAKAYAGPYAAARGKLTGTFGSETGQATQELDNLVTTNALGQLKAIFGAAPTEGERKILLDIQGSSDLPHALRVRIYDRAAALAEKRLEFNRQRASEMRGQTYFKPESGPDASRSAPTSRGAPTFSPDDLAAEARRRGLIQ